MLAGPTRRAAVLLMVLLTAIWGGSHTFVKVGFRDLPVVFHDPNEAD